MRRRVVVPTPRVLATTERRALLGAVGLTALAIALTVPAAATAAAEGAAGVALPGLAAVAAAWLLPRRHAVVVTVVAVFGIAASAGVSSLPLTEAIAAVIGPVVVAGLADLAATREVAARAAARRSVLVGRIAAIATSGEALPTILDGVLNEMARVGLRGGSIALINERDELFIAAYDGVLDESVLRLRMPVGVGIMGKVAATGRPVLVGDLDRPAGGPEPANRTVGTNAAIRSIAVVPIRAEGKVVGVLEIDSTEVARFDADDLVLLEQIALAISGAVQQAGPLRLANELLQRRVAELVALQDTARTLAASLDIDVVLRSVAASTASGLAVPVALVVRIAPEGATTMVMCVDGATSLAPASLPLDAVPDLCDAVASGEVRSLAEVPAAPRLAALEARHRLRSALVAPVRTAGGFTGALVACSPDDRGFDPAQAQLLGGIAHLAGLALANADAYRRLAEAAVTDTLTGLPNLLEFERRLGEAHRTDFSVVAVDVDNLKQVNDGYGHEAGDLMLQRIAATLVAVVGGRGTVARTGGDEFAIVLPGISGTDAVVMAQRMRDTMHGVAVPYGLARISAGSASGPAGADAREVWWAAEEALYRAKQWGRDRIEVARATAAALQSPLRRWDTLVNELLAAHGVEAVFQPVVRLSDRNVVAHEALARPAGADAGMDVEGLFSAAHRIGLARDLDWLCRRAAFDAGRSIPAGVPLFVNVGVWALLDPLHDVDQMLLLLRWAGRSPRDVVLEITEREVISDLRRFEEVLTAYRAEGFRFAIDDVGEGHSTLEVLAAGAPEYVKIARSLVCGIDRVGALAAVRAVVAFARETGAEVIAEGIERESDVDALTELGVALGQGWHLGRPARVAAAIEVTGTASRPLPPTTAGPTSVMSSPGRPPSHPY